MNDSRLEEDEIEEIRPGSVQEIKEANHAHFMKHGPGLSYGYGTYVVAKDTVNGKVLIGGLGGMGVGQMWEDIDLKHDSKRRGWDEAPEIKSPPR